MKVAIVGSGYVGVCTGVALAESGHAVRFADVDAGRVRALASGAAPFFEEGLDAALAALRIPATTDVAGAAADADVALLAVGTPSRPDGSLDLAFVEAAAETVGRGFRGRRDFPVVAVKSTVLPGTAERVVRPVVERASGLVAGSGFGVASNPEFLAEGTALRDARRPDRVVVGAGDDRTRRKVLELYAKLDCPKFSVDAATAELAKYASNAFLAARVGLANEVANLARRVGADSSDVLGIVGADPRVGAKFLRPGAGFGGSCFPKDLSALASAFDREGVPAGILRAVLDENEEQPLEVVRILEEALGTLGGAKVALLGLAFKAGTDDVRESRAIPIHRALVERGADVVSHDPLPRARQAFLAAVPGARVAASATEAIEGADAVVLQTEDPAWTALGPRGLSKTLRKVVVDGRRNFRPDDFRGAGARYLAVGLGGASASEPS